MPRKKGSGITSAGLPLVEDGEFPRLFNDSTDIFKSAKAELPVISLDHPLATIMTAHSRRLKQVKYLHDIACINMNLYEIQEMHKTCNESHK